MTQSRRLAASAAPATAPAPAPAPPAAPASAPSRTYPTITAVVLTAGWYLAPVLGWIGGLVVIGLGDRWLPAVKRRAILTSIAAGVVAGLALLVFRGTEVWGIGLALFLVVPRITNIFVGSSLRADWR